MEQLPNEILIRILQYLNTYDLLQFCTVFKDFDFFLREKRCISITDFSNRFEIQDMNLCKFISVKMNPNYIKTLKINGIYWIPGHDLRKLISKLPALEELYALDTELGLKREDIVEYFKLKKLACSITDDPFDKDSIEACKNLTSLKHLHLKITLLEQEDMQDIESVLEKLLCNLKYLEELWIQDDPDSLDTLINFEILVARLENIKKIVLLTIHYRPEDYLADFTRTFQCRRSEYGAEIIFEKNLHTRPSFGLDSPKSMETALEKAWNVFESSYRPLSCGPNETRLLILKEELTNIKFQELHLGHDIIFCDSKFVEAAYKILTSDNCRGLKKLNFGCCFFQSFNKSRKRKGGDKRQRIENYSFEIMAKNIKDLTELQISYSKRFGYNISAYPYSLIPNFEKLQRLTLGIPEHLDGLFLEQVFETCQNIEYLYLTTHTNELFLQNLYKYLPYAGSLKHFRLECQRVNFENLFMSLSQIKIKKVLRIYIECDNILDIFTNNEQGLFSSFFEAQPQLVFFFLVVHNITFDQISYIQTIFNENKKGNPANIFYCRDNPFDIVPSAHRDIIFEGSRVARIDFDKF